MFSKQNNRFTKRSKKKTRRTARRNGSRKMAAAFETLEDRQLLTIATVPWVANTIFNQFAGDGPTAFGLGIKDYINVVGPDGQDRTADEPGFVGFKISKDPDRVGKPCDVQSGVIECGSQSVSGGGVETVAENTIFESSWGAEGGLEVDTARIGIEYGFYANAGTASLLQDGDLNYEIEPQGDGTWKLSASAAADYGSLRTISPTVSVYADFVVELEGRIHGEICVAACGGLDEPFDFDVRVPLASINRQDIEQSDTQNKLVLDGAIKVFGLESIGDFVADIVVGPEAGEELLGGDREATADAEIAAAERAIRKFANNAAASVTATKDLADSRARRQAAKDAKDEKRKPSKPSDVFDTSFVDINVSPAESGLLGVKAEVSASVPLAETGLSATTRIATVTGTWPEVNLLEINDSTLPITEQDGGNPDHLRASTDDAGFDNDKRKILDLDINAVNLLRMSPLSPALAILGPAAPYVGSGSISAGPVTASLTGIDYDVKTALRVNQQVDAKKSGAGTMIAYFKDANGNAVTMSSIEGSIACPSDVVNAVCFTNGTDITFDPPSNVEDLQVEIGFERDFDFTNNIGLDFDIQGTLTVLKASLEAFGLGFELGPAFEHTHQLFQSDKLPIFDNSFAVTQTAKIDPITIDVRDKADLSVEIVDAPRYYLATVGETLTVNVEVQNEGWGTAENFCLSTDVLKTGLEIVGGGTCTGSPGIQIASLAAFDKTDLIPIELRVTADHGVGSQPAVDVLNVSANLLDPQFDSDPNNNEATLRIPGVKLQELYVTKSEDTDNDVNCEDSNQACSLREALKQAGSTIGPAVILIEPGINPKLDSVITVTDSASIRGQGSSQTTISSNNPDIRLLTLQGIGEPDDPFGGNLGNTYSVAGLKFEGADVALWVRNSELFVDDVHFHDNGVGFHGNGASTIRDSHFEGNGRGINSLSGLLSIEDSTFKESQNGAIYFDRGLFGERRLKISNSTFSQNAASTLGAAVTIANNSDFKPPVFFDVEDSYFYDNDGASAGNLSIPSDATVTSFGGNLSDDQSLPLEPSVSTDLAQGISRWQASAESLGAGFIDTDITAPQQADIGIYDAATGGGVSYEFIYNVAEVMGVSSAFMGSLNALAGQSAGLKFDQWPNSGAYGATAFGVADFGSGVPHKVGADTHVVFVTDGTDMHLYVNGEFAETMVGASFALSGLTGIGHAYNHSDGSSVDPIGGTLLGVSVYDVALDADAIRANFTDLAAVSDDRSNTNLFDISGVGRPLLGVDIQRELAGAVVGGINWNGFEELVDISVCFHGDCGTAELPIKDDRFELVANVLKLKDDVQLGTNEQPFEVTLKFTDSTGTTFEDTLKLKPGSLPTIASLQVDNPLLDVARNEEGEFVLDKPSALLTWTRVPLTSYDLHVSDAEGKNLLTINEDACDAFDAVTCSATVEGLPYLSDLTYTVTPRNTFGAGTPGVALSRTRIEPPSIPQNLQVTAISQTELELTWSHDPEDGRVRNYDVELYDDQGNLDRTIQLRDPFDPTPANGTYFTGADDCTNGLTGETIPPSSCEFDFEDGNAKLTVRGIEPNTSATFAVIPFNSSGGSQAQVTGRTLTEEVTQVSGLQVQALSTSSVQLSWNDVDHELNYQVAFGIPGDTETPRARRFFTADTSAATINNLSPGSTYEFQVIAGNSVGTSQTELVSVTLPSGPAVIVTEDVTSPLDSAYRIDGSNDDGDSDFDAPPVNEDIDKAFDNTTSKYLNFLDLNSGVNVTPVNGASVVTGVRVYTANDVEARDPASYKLEGLNTNGEYVTISEGPLALPSARNVSGRAITTPNSQMQDTVVDVAAIEASSFWGDRVATNLINGSGLDETGDVHDIDPSNMWMATNDENPTVTFQFGEEVDLTEMQVWNYTEDVPGRFDLVGRAVKDASIWILENGSFQRLKNVTFSPFDPASGSPHPSEVIDLRDDSGQPISAEAIRIEVLSNHNGKIYGDPTSDDGFGNFTGLAEVQFFADTSSIPLNQDTVTFENTKAYSTYRLTFPTLKNVTAANSMQVAEIELLGTYSTESPTTPDPSPIDQWQDTAISVGAGFTATDISEPQQSDIGPFDVNTGGGITYEFIYNASNRDGVSQAFMGSRNGTGPGQSAGLKLYQGADKNTYGSTEFGVLDFGSGVANAVGIDTHVVFVADSNDMHIYVNGEFAETMPNASVSVSGLTGLGHAYDHSNGTGFDPFAGTLLGVAVYDVALDGDAIRNNFNSFTNDTTKQSNDGDFDGNGKVDFADFLVLSANFGNDVEACTNGDIDGNGKVEFADFLVLSSNFGKTVAPAAAAAPQDVVDAIWAGDDLADADNVQEDELEVLSALISG